MPLKLKPKCIIFIAIICVVQIKLVCSAREFKESQETTTDSWKGKWFPNAPGAPMTRTMGVAGECDDGVKNLSVDFNDTLATHSIKYMCLEDKKRFTPSYEVEPIVTMYAVPPLYKAQHHCLNESISYSDRLPTFGPHRQLWPVYGEYSYLPPQRWLHTLEHGGIAVLQHPCANQQQTDKLRDIVRKCLYRHIMSPFLGLTKEHPFALVAWGISLEMSVIDKTLVEQFLKDHALKGPEKVSRNGQYRQALVTEAKIVSDQDDNTLCPS